MDKHFLHKLVFIMTFTTATEKQTRSVVKFFHQKGAHAGAGDDFRPLGDVLSLST